MFHAGLLNAHLKHFKTVLHSVTLFQNAAS